VEQRLLPLLCTSLQSSVLIATTVENLSIEIHDLSSQVANLDLSPQPSNLAPLQASLRHIASCLPSAAQTSFPPCNDPTLRSYNHYYLSPNGIPSGNQRWYGLVYLVLNKDRRRQQYGDNGTKWQSERNAKQLTPKRSHTRKGEKYLH